MSIPATALQQPLRTSAQGTEERLHALENAVRQHLSVYTGHEITAGYHEKVNVTANQQRYTIYWDATKTKKKWEQIVNFDPVSGDPVSEERAWYDVNGNKAKTLRFSGFEKGAGGVGLIERFLCVEV